MSNATLTTHPPAATAQPFGGIASLRKFTVDEYHRMIDAGILAEGEPVELLEGYLVLKVREGSEYDDSLPFGGMANMRRFTIDEYHKLIRTGILTEYDPVELLEGHVVLKMPRIPEHDGPMDLFDAAIAGLPLVGWFFRGQRAITLVDGSEPEPDYALVRGTRRDYSKRHPRPGDIALVVEMSNTSLGRDTTEKASLCARAGIPVYWIVNLVGRGIQVYTGPSGPADTPAYARREDFPVGTAVPVVVDGVTVGSIAVADVMP